MPYPIGTPHDGGMLDVGDGHRLFWEARGNPHGRPAVILHGGPGSGSSPAAACSFNPARYRVVLFDQRGCGRSTPSAAGARDLVANTTHHLVADIERLRRHLAVERWLVLGGSWGSALALAYAQRHPDAIAAMVLWGITVDPPREIDWLARGGLARFFPAAWERLLDALPPADRGDAVAGYDRLLWDADATVRARAAAAWHAWEEALLAADGATPPTAWADPAFRLARARIVLRYFRNGCWLPGRVLLREAHRLHGIPGVLVQGRLDLQAPLQSAWELARAWPGARLVIAASGGHATSDPETADALAAATDALADGARF